MASRGQSLSLALVLPAVAALCAPLHALDAAAGPARVRAPQSPQTLTFDETCAPGQRTLIAAVGDLLFHEPLQLQAYRPGATFRQFWSPVAAVLAGADVTYGNLESPIAAGVRAGGLAHKDPGRVLDRVVYGRRGDGLVFNVHPSVAGDLKASGFAVVSTANNHAADRGPLGIDRTLEALTAAGLAHTGARARGASTPWHARTSANGVTLAWLACTFGLNGMPDPQGQVLQCHRDRAVVLDEIRTLAADPTVDAVIVTPHWGEEYQQRPAPRERVLAQDMVAAGATAVIGAHPHVLQPWEKVVTGSREALVIYSLGNFISNQRSEAQRSGVIAMLELTKPASGPTRLSAAGYVPTFVEIGSAHRVTELMPGRSAYEATTRLLPVGNRVTAAHASSLPRACKPQPPESVVVATAAPVLPALVLPELVLPELVIPAPLEATPVAAPAALAALRSTPVEPVSAPAADVAVETQTPRAVVDAANATRPSLLRADLGAADDDGAHTRLAGVVHDAPAKQPPPKTPRDPLWPPQPGAGGQRAASRKSPLVPAA